LFARSSLSNEKSGYLFNDYKNDFQTRRTTLQVDLGVRLFRTVKIGVSGFYQQYGISDPNVSLSGRKIDDLPAFGGFLQIDTRNWALYPISGWFIRSSIKCVRSELSEFNWLHLDLRRYQPLPFGDILAIHAVAEISQGELPVYERVHMGGWRSLRGYQFGVFAGDNLFSSSIEYRFPFGFVPGPWNMLNIGVAGIAFYDIGKTWWRGEAPNFKEAHNCVGFGIHFLAHLAVFRVEYGYSGHGRGLVYLSSGVEF